MKGGTVGSNLATLVPLVLLAGAEAWAAGTSLTRSVALPPLSAPGAGGCTWRKESRLGPLWSAIAGLLETVIGCLAGITPGPDTLISLISKS